MNVTQFQSVVKQFGINVQDFWVLTSQMMRNLLEAACRKQPWGQSNNRTPKIQINAQQGGTAGSSGRSRGPPSAFGVIRDTTSFFGGSAKHDDLGKVLFAVTPVLQKGDDLCDS